MRPLSCRIAPASLARSARRSSSEGAQERRALRFQDHAHLGVRRRRHGPLDKLLLQRLLHRASSYLIYHYEK
jgi:hypothetical protein